jgi:hypothetical protein
MKPSAVVILSMPIAACGARSSLLWDSPVMSTATGTDAGYGDTVVPSDDAGSLGRPVDASPPDAEDEPSVTRIHAPDLALNECAVNGRAADA